MPLNFVNPYYIRYFHDTVDFYMEWELELAHKTLCGVFSLTQTVLKLVFK